MTESSTYLESLREKISQGDLFVRVPVVKLSHPGRVPMINEATACLLTDDCEFDKPRSEYVTIVEVRPLRELSSGSQANVRARNTLSTFYLPACEDLEESYADFARVNQVARANLYKKDENGERITSLTDDARLALQYQISVFYGFKRDEAVTSPTEEIDVSMGEPSSVQPSSDSPQVESQS